MRITKLTTYRLAPRWMFLKIDTDAGISGWGEPVIEGKARSVEAAVHEFEPYLVGQDPSRINDLWQVMYRGGFYRGGAILMSAIAGIDQALWDIKGKVLGAPVYELLGGLVRDRMKVYSWVGGDRPSKIASIGVRISHGITTHGFALNVCPDLEPFSHIVPCGIADCRVTSMAALTDTTPDLHVVQQQIAALFAARFHLTWTETVALERLATLMAQPERNLSPSSIHAPSNPEGAP